MAQRNFVKLKKHILANIHHIKQILSNGRLLDVAQYLNISCHLLRSYRKKIPELNDVIKTWENNKLGNRYNSVQKIQAQLPQVYKIAKNKGSLKAIEKYFDTTEGGLKFLRKNYRELDAVIKKGNIYYQENRFNKDGLSQIEKIISISTKKELAKFLNISISTLAYYAKKQPELRAAIKRGINYRDKEALFWKRSKVKPDFIEHSLYHIEKIVEKTGEIRSANHVLNVSKYTFEKIRKFYPRLEAVLRRAVSQYKANKKAAQLSENKLAFTEGLTQPKLQELFQCTKPKRELVARLDTIEDIGEENALARYRKMKEAEKESMSRRELKNISELI